MSDDASYFTMPVIHMYKIVSGRVSKIHISGQTLPYRECTPNSLGLDKLSYSGAQT